MSQAATNARRRARSATRQRAPSPAMIRRRRLALGAAVLLGAAVAALFAARSQVEEIVRSATLPLHHARVIRQQAADKNLDPALIAAVIYQESKFRDRTSQAGAKGLMQLLPSTAHYIARKSGGYQFESGDLATPEINIAYGSWYLRYLLDHYDGNELLAVAAYNAGETNVDRWVGKAGGPHSFDAGDDIPFPETRAYVASVEQRKHEYRDKYGAELGIR